MTHSCAIVHILSSNRIRSVDSKVCTCYVPRHIKGGQNCHSSLEFILPLAFATTAQL